MLLYLTLTACAVLMAHQVYRYDLYDREPWYALILCTLLGAAGMWLAGAVQVRVLSALGAHAAWDWNASISIAAGITEELAKAGAVVAIALVLPRHFNDPLDGLIYGAFAGLGAAIEESVVWLAGLEGAAGLPATEPIRLAGHLVMGGIGGFGLSYAWLRIGRRPVMIALPLALAIALHIAWDLIAFAAAERGRMSPLHTVLSMLLMLVGLAAFRAMVQRAGERSRVMFASPAVASATN